MKSRGGGLGLLPVVAICVGTMLGSGIFVLPGLAAQMTGPSVWLAYVLAGVLVLPAALSKAELATAMPTSGGTYFFLERAFGPLVGTISGLGLWLSLLLKSSFALVGFGAYLCVFSDLPLVPAALTLLVAITVLNVLGVRKVGVAQILVVGASLAGLCILVILGVFSVEPANLRPTFTHGGGGFIAAIAFVYVSFAGVTKVAAIAEEVKDPSRNIPLGMLLSLVMVTAVYGVVVFIMVATISVDGLRGDLSPVHTLGNTVGGTAIGLAAAVLGIITLTSMANGGLLAASRFPFAMSRDGLLPSSLKAVHPRFTTPVKCVLLTAVVMALAIVFLDIVRIVKLASAFKIMAFLAVNVVVIVFRRHRVDWYKPGYRAPLYPWAQLVGIAVGLVLLVMLGWVTVVALIAAVLPGGAIYLFYSRTHSHRTGVLAHLGPRRDLIEPRDATNGGEKQTRAGVLVTFFGQECDPEALINFAATLADGRPIHVLHLTATPKQADPEAMLDGNDLTAVLRKLVRSTSRERGLEISFERVVTQNVAKSVHDVVGRLGCEWLVMKWGGWGPLEQTRLNPLDEMIHFVPCNIAFTPSE